jgi:lantibiotic biosynthesis protein
VHRPSSKPSQLCHEPLRDEELDIIAGAAGAIPILLKRFRETQTTDLMMAARKCGQFLLEKATKTAQAWSWVGGAGSQGLTGYSHGAAGIAVALLELYGATREEIWKTAATMGFNYERSLFDVNAQNWPDLRTFGAPSATPVFGQQWCHGAPGMVLPRLRAWQLTQDPSYLTEAQTAANSTRQNLVQPGGNFSLCHGMAGNADILLEAGRMLNDPLLLQAACDVGYWGAQTYYNRNIEWPTGVQDITGVNAGPHDNPSLMVGLAGTGMFYLRLAGIQEIPTIMLLSSAA